MHVLIQLSYGTVVWLFGTCSDVEARDSLATDEDDADDEATDGEVENEDQSSEDGDDGDVDELLDEALDKDTEENNVQTDNKPSVATSSATVAADEPVSWSY